MKHLFCILFFLNILLSSAGEVSFPAFERWDTNNGLMCDTVYSLAQLADGEMAVVTRQGIQIGNRCLKFSDTQPYSIPDYKGHFHIYADSLDHLWVKNYGTLRRINLDTGEWSEFPEDEFSDVFVDSNMGVWFRKDSTLCGSVCVDIFSDYGELQDMDVAGDEVLLFYSKGAVGAYDRNDGAFLGVYPAYPVEEATRYDLTSLVVRGKDDAFYQLRHGKNNNIFLRFDPDTKQWRTIFDTSRGVFHSLCIADENTAFISCPQGLWKINLSTGEMQLHTALPLKRGQEYSGGINTVMVDEDGQLWLATYTNGVLHAKSFAAPTTWQIYWPWYLAGGFLVLALIVAFVAYAKRTTRREKELLEQIRQMSIRPEAGPGEIVADNAAEEVALSAADEEFISRASEAVVAHLNDEDYSVEQLARDLCMERTGLFKKLKALINQSPSTFMRDIRLRQAAALIKEGDLTIAEISERVGFRSPSYFTRCFTALYGLRPSDYK